MKQIRVLIIDDSALARSILKKGLSADPEIEVIGTAPDAFIGRDKIVSDEPDAITLDIEMPKMDGIEFLRRLMPQHPVPVIVVSALAEPGARATLDALQYGAIDFVLKPSSRIGTQLEEMIEDLSMKLKVAAETDVSSWAYRQPKKRRPDSQVLVGSTDKVVVIGASTGGTVAIRNLIEGFPTDIPGTAVVQHMPPVFTKMFADRLNETAVVEVKEAENGDKLMPGRVLIAPGGEHLEVIRSGGEYRVRCRKGEKVNGHCPSVEVLFDSVARHVGPNAVGVMLTGMGRDGADAMLRLRKAGARTVAQDEATSVVYGMPREAFECGGAEEQVAIEDMANAVLSRITAME